MVNSVLAISIVLVKLVSRLYHALSGAVDAWPLFCYKNITVCKFLVYDCFPDWFYFSTSSKHDNNVTNDQPDTVSNDSTNKKNHQQLSMNQCALFLEVVKLLALLSRDKEFVVSLIRSSNVHSMLLLLMICLQQRTTDIYVSAFPELLYHHDV